MEHTAEGLALDHDLVGLVREIADDLLLPEGVLCTGMLQQDQIHEQRHQALPAVGIFRPAERVQLLLAHPFQPVVVLPHRMIHVFKLFAPAKQGQRGGQRLCFVVQDRLRSFQGQQLPIPHRMKNGTVRKGVVAQPLSGLRDPALHVTVKVIFLLSGHRFSGIVPQIIRRPLIHISAGTDPFADFPHVLNGLQLLPDLIDPFKIERRIGVKAGEKGIADLLLLF